MQVDSTYTNIAGVLGCSFVIALHRPTNRNGSIRQDIGRRRGSAKGAELSMAFDQFFVSMYNYGAFNSRGSKVHVQLGQGRVKTVLPVGIGLLLSWVHTVRLDIVTDLCRLQRGWNIPGL